MRVKALVGSMLVGAMLPVMLIGLLAGADSSLLAVMVGALGASGSALIAVAYVLGGAVEARAVQVAEHGNSHLSC